MRLPPEQRAEEGERSQNLLRLTPRLVRKEKKGSPEEWEGQLERSVPLWQSGVGRSIRPNGEEHAEIPRLGVVSQLGLPLLEALIGSESRTTQSNS